MRRWINELGNRTKGHLRNLSASSGKSMNPGTPGKVTNGRVYNDQLDLYKLPADNEEYKRLNLQHSAFRLAMDGLYPCKDLVEAILDPTVNANPKIMDLGCGSGIWAREMAIQFPHASVVGIDLAPGPGPTPPNCRFEVHDINKGLKEFSEYDLINARCICGGIRNFTAMMHEAESCLKPGGLLIVMDGEARLYGEDMIHPIPVGIDSEGGETESGSWTARIAHELGHAIVYDGSDIHGMDKILGYGPWDHPLLDPNTVRVGGLFTPIGPWATASDPQENQRLQLIGTLIGDDFCRLVSSSWQLLLKQHDLPVEQWSRWAQEEIEAGRFRMYMHWKIIWGTRRTKPEIDDQTGKSSQEGMDGSKSVSDGTIQSKGSTWFPIYSSKENAAQAADDREEAAKSLPTPLVTKLKEAVAASQ